MQRLEPVVNAIEAVARPQLDVGGHLVVPAARSMQLAADIADPIDQRGFDVHVDVFALQDERECASFDLGPNFRQSSHNLLAFVIGDQTDVREHPGMGGRPNHVVLKEPTVKGDRFRELFDPTVGFFAKSAAPRLIRHRAHLPSNSL